MRYKILTLIVLLMIPLVSAQEVYYNLDLHYDKGDVSLTKLSVNPLIDSSELFDIGGNKVEVVSLDNVILHESNFLIPNEIIYDSFDEEGNAIGGGITILDEVDFNVKLPYFENAKKINLYDENEDLLLNVDIGQFSKVILEEVSEQVEGDGLELLKREETSKPEKFSTGLVMVISLLLLFVVLIVSYLIIRKKNKG